MSRQLEAAIEARIEKVRADVLHACFGGLEAGVSHAGGELTGFTVKYDGGGVLLVLRAVFPGGAMVGFVGSEDLAAGLAKAAREAARDAIKWKVDQWA